MKTDAEPDPPADDDLEAKLNDFCKLAGKPAKQQGKPKNDSSAGLGQRKPKQNQTPPANQPIGKPKTKTKQPMHTGTPIGGKPPARKPQQQTGDKGNQAKSKGKGKPNQGRIGGKGTGGKPGNQTTQRPKPSNPQKGPHTTGAGKGRNNGGKSGKGGKR